MPTLNKVYTLTITPEQFIEACSDVELQELEMLLNRKLEIPKETRLWLEEDTQE